MADYRLRIIVEGVDDASGPLSGIAGSLQSLGTAGLAAVAGGAAAVTAGLVKSVQAAGDFESGMNSFAAVAGGALDASGLKVADFRDLFISLGKELPVSTSEVQQAAIELVKGGIDPATVAAGGLKQTLQFAAAGGLDLASAATIAAKAVGGWVPPMADAGERASFLTHATDLLSQAANASTVNVDDLAMGLYNVQGTAKLAGASFDETVTALAMLAPSFSSSADAGTSLKVMLARLQPTTAPAIAAMTALGLFTEQTGSAFYDATGKFVGMEQASGLLQNALAGLTNEQKQQYLQTIFGQDAIRAAAVLAEQGATGYRNMAGALAQQNSAAEMAALKQQGFNTALDNAKGSVEALMITVGSALLPVLTTLLNTIIAPGINTITTFAASILSASNPMAALVTAINSVLPGFAGFVAWLQQAMVALQPLGALIQANLTPILAGLAAVIGGALLVALGSLIASLAAAAAPILALVAVAAALYAAWQTNFLGIQTVTTTVMTAIGSFVQSGLALIQSFWQAHGATITADVQAIWSQVESIISGALTLIGALISSVLATIQSIWQAHGDQIVAAWSALWNMSVGIAQAGLAIVQGVIQAALAIMRGDWEAAGQAILSAIEGMWAGIERAFSAGAALLAAATEAAVSAVRNAWESFISSASSIGSRIIDGIRSGIVSAAGSLAAAAASAARAALDAAKSALGISSPSKLFAEQVGQPIVAGMAQGIMRNSDMVGQAAAGAGLRAAGRMPQAAASSSAITINVDARGATMRPEEFRKIILDVVNEQARNADRRMRVGGII